MSDSTKKPVQILNLKVPDNTKTGEFTDGDTAALEIPLLCSCGKPWDDDAQFCEQCGAKRPVVEIEISDSIICPNGHENVPGAKFCMICGIKIN